MCRSKNERAGGKRCTDHQSKAKVQAYNQVRRERYKTAVEAKSGERRQQMGDSTVTGAQANNEFAFSTQLQGGYDPEKVNPIRNKMTYSWSKPLGGMWMGMKEEDGFTAWQGLVGTPEDGITDGFESTDLKFKEGARVVRISTLEQYKRLLDVYGYRPKVSETDKAVAKMLFHVEDRHQYHSMSNIKPDGTGKRGVDYKKLSKDFDAMIVTVEAVHACGRFGTHSEIWKDDQSLETWDIASTFVMNKNSVEVA